MATARETIEFESAIDAIELAARDERATSARRRERSRAPLTAGRAARRIPGRLADLAANAVVGSVAVGAGAVASLLYALSPGADGPSCPQCGGRTGRVGETVAELGAGMLHKELLYCCTACGTISKEDVVVRVGG